MSINNNVNWRMTSACPTSFMANNNLKQYCRNAEYYFSMLQKWCNEQQTQESQQESQQEVQQSAQQALKQLMTFWNDFKTNVYENKIPDTMSDYCNSIKPKTFKRENDTMPNEVCRLIMFCYISLILYLLNIRNDAYEYVLMYHCKSGQDRTGTFYAINQMVNQITDNYFNQIMNDINGPNKSFKDIYNTYYNPKPPPQQPPNSRW